MNFFRSGNKAVDQIGQMNFSGNITPQIWYRTILTDRKKPHYLAISILSDIVYWYRPTEIRDEHTGQVIGWKRKFKYDMLQRSYEQLGELYGENTKTVSRAVVFLETLGVIRRHRKTLHFSNGMIVRNVLFLELIPEKLYELTYPEESQVAPVRSTSEDMNSSDTFEVVDIVEENTAERQEASGETDQEADSSEAQPRQTGKSRKTKVNAGTDDVDQIPGQTRESGKTEKYAGADNFDQIPRQTREGRQTEKYAGPDNFDQIPRQTREGRWTEMYADADSFDQIPGQTREGRWTEMYAGADSFDQIPRQIREEGRTKKFRGADNSDQGPGQVWEAGWTEMERQADKSDHVSGQICPPTQTNLTGRLDSSVHDTGQIWPEQWTEMVSPPVTDVRTNTEITTQTLTENTSYHSINHPTENYFAQSSDSQIDLNDPNTQALAYMQIIRDNLNYDEVMEYKSDEDKQEIEEAYNLICDVVCVKRQTINIGGVEYPWELVKSRFLKLTWEHVDYVSLCMHDRGGREGISNIHAYMLAALYNAPSTMNRYYEQRVRHDFYRRDDRVNA